MTPLEAAVGVPYGEDLSARVPVPGRLPTPLAVLEEAVLDALSRPPCIVSFSGGRDSSSLLGVAVRLARRHGLPEPVAVTLRFPLLADADESHWQELVAAWLGLREWERIEIHDELDLVGELTAARLRRYGPLYPANACFMVPLARLAAGGSVVIGLGGDELFGLWARHRLADVLARRVRPRLRDVGVAGLALAPRRIRRGVLVRRGPDPAAPQWLRPAASIELAALEAAELAAEPARWDRFARSVVRRRDVTLALRSLALIAAEFDARVHAPLVDARFAAALGRAGRWTGWPTRAAAMAAVFDGAVPRDLLERRDKAVLNGVFWTAKTRRFAERWSGKGLDERVVDPDSVRRSWLAAYPDQRAGMLLQAAWLHDQRGAVV